MNRKNWIFFQTILLGLIVVATVFNGWQTAEIMTHPLVRKSLGEGGEKISAAGSGLIKQVIPAGRPRIYGDELGVSFDDIKAENPSLADAVIKKLGDLDRQINLDGEELSRYIKIVSQISCEYCCGAQSIIFPDGKAACGCAHSFAMRGAAKFLVNKHGQEFTDDQILEELGKWKTLFFPDLILAKAAVLKEKGIELNYINLTSNKYRGIEKGAGGSGGMVGGC